MLSGLRVTLFIAAFCIAASRADAATLNVIGGQLFGASNVDVDGLLYDVEFIDGACVDLFSGCDEAGDFTFNTSADALAASQALLDQVFIDGGLGSFDSDTSLINGCSGGSCSVWTVYALNTSTTVLAGQVRNWDSGELADETFLNVPNKFSDLSLSTTFTYAVWTPVPEPNTVLMLAAGFGLLAQTYIRQRR